MINHCRALKVEPDATPQPYWINTSGNYIVKRFIEKANQQTRREIEQLIEGKAIQKEIRLELTRKDENRLKDFCKACEKALKQIKEKHYDHKLEEGYETILNYGIACYKKRCKVMVDK